MAILNVMKQCEIHVSYKYFMAIGVFAHNSNAVCSLDTDLWISFFQEYIDTKYPPTHVFIDLSCSSVQAFFISYLLSSIRILISLFAIIKKPLALCNVIFDLFYVFRYT
jgi:hypothetical protein